MITQVYTQNDDTEKIESTEQMILQSGNFDWEENILVGVLNFVTVFLSVFLYRKYNGERK